MNTWLFVIPILVTLGECNAARILAALPLPIVSHHNFFRPILRELANRGHDVTVITALPEENANYKQIIIKNVLEEKKVTINFFEMQHSYWILDYIYFAFLCGLVSHETLKSPEVVNLIHSNDERFDLVLVESTFFQEVYTVFGHKFGAPVVELRTLCSGFWLNEVTSNPYTFSYFVDYKTHSSDVMNFYERLQNTILGISTLIMHRYILLPKQEVLEKLYFNYTGWETRPPLIQLLSNISLVVLNTHVALHYPQPNNPNMIQVAGIHIKPPKKLPQELQSYLDSAVNGVIYFSLGSNVKGSMMPETARNAFLSAFSLIPQQVLWKWEEESMPNKPSNVKISKWLPQTDILAHPNVKAFISHGGLLSLTESVYHGVPLILIPLFGDQKKNSIQAEKVGFVIHLDFDNITAESVFWSLNKLLTDNSYQEAAQRQSKIFRDNPLSPKETAMYWIEYVIRYKGAPHMRTAAASLAWYQYFLIDVIAVLLLGVVFVLFMMYIVFRAVFRRTCKRKTESRTVKSSKKKD